MTPPPRVHGEVFSVSRSGDYTHLTLVAAGVAERARPGTFVLLGVGGEMSATVLPRPYWVYRAKPSGAYGSTVEVVVSPRGPGSRWLTGRRAHDTVEITGPLGRPFALPKEPVTCALVAEGYASALMFGLAERLRDRGCPVHMVLGAEREPGLFGALQARRAARSVTVTTHDGSVGIRGSVVDVLPSVLQRHEAEVVYACGPSTLLADAARVAGEGGAWCQVAVERPLPCGFGACGGCELPVRGDDGVLRSARACVDGPVLPAERVAWDQLSNGWGSPG